MGKREGGGKKEKRGREKGINLLNLYPGSFEYMYVRLSVVA